MPTSLTSPPSLQQRLAQCGGRPSGFDYLRVVLAVGVLTFHSFEICYGVLPNHQAFRSAWRPLVVMLLPMFFALSGFLVAGSLERSANLRIFAGLRVLRIMPALAGEVLLSALLIGSLLSSLPWADYLTHPDFRHYFWNMLGHIHYRLPGVFEHNPVDDKVNAQLWTVPWELVCYVLLLLMAANGLVKKAGGLTLCIALMFVCQFSIDGLLMHDRGFVLPSFSLPICFLLGVALYRFRAAIPWSPVWALVSAGLYLFLVADVRRDALAVVPLAYLAVYAGMTQLPRHRALLSGDYSYGIFLYGYVIQQTFSALLPGLREWYWNLLLALPCTLVLAVFSWWVIERPALSLRGRMKGFRLFR